MRRTWIALATLLLSVMLVPAFAGDNEKDTPTTKPASKTSTSIRKLPGEWTLFAYTLDMPGKDQQSVRTLRGPRLSAITKGLKAAGFSEPQKKGSTVNLLDRYEEYDGRGLFNTNVRDNPRIPAEKYREYLAALYDGGVLLQRVVMADDGFSYPADEEPVLLAAGYEEWTKVEKLVRAPATIAARPPQAKAVVASTGLAPLTTAAANAGNGPQK